jgi:hypothetical protein
MRYVPALKSILEALSNDELSLEDYPSVTPMPTPSASQAGRSNTARGSRKASGAAASARKNTGASSKWSANSNAGGPSGSGKRSGGPVNFLGARNMVFVIGGMCYPEMRVAREVMENEAREIILGSSAFLSANEFLDDLGKLAVQKH